MRISYYARHARRFRRRVPVFGLGQRSGVTPAFTLVLVFVRRFPALELLSLFSPSEQPRFEPIPIPALEPTSGPADSCMNQPATVLWFHEHLGERMGIGPAETEMER